MLGKQVWAVGIGQDVRMGIINQMFGWENRLEKCRRDRQWAEGPRCTTSIYTEEEVGYPECAGGARLLNPAVAWRPCLTFDPGGLTIIAR